MKGLASQLHCLLSSLHCLRLWVIGGHFSCLHLSQNDTSWWQYPDTVVCYPWQTLSFRFQRLFLLHVNRCAYFTSRLCPQLSPISYCKWLLCFKSCSWLRSAAWEKQMWISCWLLLWLALLGFSYCLSVIPLDFSWCSSCNVPTVLS